MGTIRCRLLGLTAEGWWIQDRASGLQFKAEMLNNTAPTTKEGIEKYLDSGMIKGIGPIYGKKLVATFGEEIFEIIESRSARLGPSTNCAHQALHHTRRRLADSRPHQFSHRSR